MVLDREVRTVMQPDVEVVDVTAPISSARRLLDERTFHHVPVVDGAQLVGIISALDLARVNLDAWVADVETRDAWMDQTLTIRDVMTPLPEVLHPDDSVQRAAELLSNGAFHALPVVDTEGTPVGILTSTDLVRLLHAALQEGR